MALPDIVKGAVISQLDEIATTDTDTLIDVLDIDEDTVDHLRNAINNWIKTDLGDKIKDRDTFGTSRRHKVKNTWRR